MAGVDWSNAPDFANGMMPTQLGPIKVAFNGTPAFIYYYCSAVTNPNCADDQINVLAPSTGLGKTGSPVELIVGNNGASDLVSRRDRAKGSYRGLSVPPGS